MHPYALRYSSFKYVTIFSVVAPSTPPRTTRVAGTPALLVGRLDALGARRHFHHGLQDHFANLVALCPLLTSSLTSHRFDGL
jgi:hypothetical protein